MASGPGGFPRLTRDLDLLIPQVDLERATATLGKMGFTIPGGTIPFDVGKEHERRVLAFQQERYFGERTQACSRLKRRVGNYFNDQ